MDILIDHVLANPLLSFVLALLCVLLLFAVLKGLIKLLIGIIILGVVSVIYVNYFQEDYPLPVIDEDIIEKWNEWSEPIRSLDLNYSLFENNQSILPLLKEVGD